MSLIILNLILVSYGNLKYKLRKWLVQVQVEAMSWVEILVGNIVCTPMEGNKNGTICNYCGLTIKNDRITHIKLYLSHTDPNSNTKKCPNVPPEVK